MLNSDGSEKTQLLDVLVRPYPARVAGTPLSWSFDEGSRSFTLSWRQDPNVSAPTEIVVPARVYPAPQIECSGCESRLEAGRLLITRPPSADPASVSVHP